MRTPQEFHDICAAHDWYYTMSDDAAAHRRGRDSGMAIRAEAESNPVLQEIYDAWARHVFNNAPEPTRPEESQ